MSKLGVGVGEDFPVDEKAQQDTGCCGADRHEVRRQWHQMRAEWRARKRAMREQFRREFANDPELRHHVHRTGVLALAGLAAIGLAALLASHHHSD